MTIIIQPEHVWVVVVGFILSFILAFGIGANDVANSFGTSVGAKVLTLRQACILGTVFETLGAVLLGSKVSDTIWREIVDTTPYMSQNSTDLRMLGDLSALSGSCVWMLGATILRLPISGTHSIVGASIGFAVVTNGASGIRWRVVGKIVAAWIVAPVLSGAVSIGIFYFCRYFILSKADPLEPGLRLLPIFYASTVAINLFSVFYDGPKLLGFEKIPLYGTFILSFGTGIICAIVVRVFIVPWHRRKIRELCYSSHIEKSKEDSADDIREVRQAVTESVKDGMRYSSRRSSGGSQGSSGDALPLMESGTSPNSGSPAAAPALNGILTKQKRRMKLESAEDAPSRRSSAEKLTQKVSSHEAGKRPTIADQPETAKLFSFLQALTAVAGAFAHGGNDVSNAIGPLVSLWLAARGYISASTATPLWILFYGGVGMSVGLWVWGRKVIKTTGEDLTKVTPSSGFCIEIGSALTALIASNARVPISTTHCKVASIVSVGRFRAQANVDWSVFRNILLAWVITLPVTGGISAAIMTGLRQIVQPQLEL